jgi:hypothetical protein
MAHHMISLHVTVGTLRYEGRSLRAGTNAACTNLPRKALLRIRTGAYAYLEKLLIRDGATGQYYRC